jgi:hypothetical protein
MTQLLRCYKVVEEILVIYIAGPITGRPGLNRKAFADAQLRLAIAGYPVVNPHELTHDHDKSWSSYMRECVAALVYCDGIYMLPGWWRSRGAITERLIAWRLEIRRVRLNEWSKNV